MQIYNLFLQLINFKWNLYSFWQFLTTQEGI